MSATAMTSPSARALASHISALRLFRLGSLQSISSRLPSHVHVAAPKTSFTPYRTFASHPSSSSSSDTPYSFDQIMSQLSQNRDLQMAFFMTVQKNPGMLREIQELQKLMTDKGVAPDGMGTTPSMSSMYKMVMDTEIREKLEKVTEEMKRSGFFSENSHLLKTIFGTHASPFDDPETLAAASKRGAIPERMSAQEDDVVVVDEKGQGVVDRVKKMFKKF
ncbi:hypothetical protein M427DRAFT_68454 [Gonapodya prolifera JEL478]|uniref:Uncharacterized protein n=1 Tax=Gonapodya prolifera (strain JEL478) TaxID=1344416 RepID=A0A139AKL4_GONPJ|nr:hypothetical protein M427DRAFT_68454 [Gonapodya prolifera JEL478]|eukprot:KXS17310.1 hypothetical protein M427DRAFT_68454 [Gonapodya prolifera JEL478]